MKQEKYRLDMAPQLLVAIKHKTKYAIKDTLGIEVMLTAKEYKLVSKMNKALRTPVDLFYLREFVAKQVRTEVRRLYPKAAFANIVHVMPSFKGKYYNVTIDVDVLE